MNVTVLLATFFVELAIGVLGFISMHLRNAAERRRLARLPTWEQLPFSFKMDYYDHPNGEVIKPTKLKVPPPRRV